MNQRLVLMASIVLGSASAGLFACDGPVLWSGPSDGGSPEDANDLDVNQPGLDATPGHDGGADGGQSDGATSCQAKAWPAMLAAAITPLQSIANLNMNESGPGATTLAYGETVNCPATFLDAGAYQGAAVAAWGPSNDVEFQYDLASPNLIYELQLTGAYAGTLAFHSRTGGAYGNHTYVIGVNQLSRDGSPFAIDWTGSSADQVAEPAITSVSELFDGIMATFAPTSPVESADCYDAVDCLIVPDDLAFEANDGGIPSSAVFGVRPLKIYVQIPVGSSVPNELYVLFTGGPDLQNPAQDDAGTMTGIDAGGAVSLPKVGCVYGSADLWGSCASPTGPLCNQAGFAPFSCRDYPQSGYVVTCCPTDGG